MGIVMGSIVAYALSHSMSVENLESWGWRIPFILAMFIGLIGVYIRTKVQESPLYLEAKSHNNISTSPTTELITQYWKELLLAICIYLTVTVPFYTLTTYVTTYLIKNANFTLQSALIVNICAMTSAIIFLPIAAKLSDVYGRKPILLMSAAMLIVTVYPLFSLLSNATMTSAIISQIIFGAIAAFYMGPIPALLVELFPTRIRSTGVGISYNISAAVFGGTTPLVMTKMIQHSQNSQYMAYYIMIFAVLSLIALYFYQDRFKQPLL
jgi:MHS family proline/betaine transporter-like MFS transporter